MVYEYGNTFTMVDIFVTAFGLDIEIGSTVTLNYGSSQILFRSSRAQTSKFNQATDSGRLIFDSGPIELQINQTSFLQS